VEKLARQDDPAERLGLRRGSNADGRVGRPHGRVSAGDRVAGEACSEVEAVAFPVSIAVGAGHVALDADRARLRRKRNVLVYMVYSDRLIEGSPKNLVLDEVGTRSLCAVGEPAAARGCEHDRDKRVARLAAATAAETKPARTRQARKPHPGRLAIRRDLT